MLQPSGTSGGRLPAMPARAATPRERRLFLSAAVSDLSRLFTGVQACGGGLSHCTNEKRSTDEMNVAQSDIPRRGIPLRCEIAVPHCH